MSLSGLKPHKQFCSPKGNPETIEVPQDLIHWINQLQKPSEAHQQADLVDILLCMICSLDHHLLCHSS